MGGIAYTITSPKHPGAVFIAFRQSGSREGDFVCKLYEKHADLAPAILTALNASLFAEPAPPCPHCGAEPEEDYADRRAGAKRREAELLRQVDAGAFDELFPADYVEPERWPVDDRVIEPERLPYDWRHDELDDDDIPF